MPCRKFAILLLIMSGVTVALAEDRETPWPLTKGSYWVYHAEVQSQQTTGILATQLAWRMEVVDAYRRDDIDAALIRGHPADLAFYTRGAQPRFWVLVRIGSRYYVLRQPAAWSRLHNRGDALSDLIATPNELFSFPMKPGDLFAQDPRENDNLHGWYVEDVRPTNLAGLSGAPSLPEAQEFILAKRTESGTETVTFVPRIGITRYVYHHIGTVSEVDAILVQMHQAATHGRKASKD